MIKLPQDYPVLTPSALNYSVGYTYGRAGMTKDDDANHDNLHDIVIDAASESATISGFNVRYSISSKPGDKGHFSIRITVSDLGLDTNYPLITSVMMDKYDHATANEFAHGLRDGYIKYLQKKHPNANIKPTNEPSTG